MDVVVAEAGESFPQLPSILVCPSTSKGNIAFCDLCFEAGLFRDLSADDVERITWFFGAAYFESSPQRSIELLEPMLAKWRAPDLLLLWAVRTSASAGPMKERPCSGKHYP
jgi:hypothetical protein